MYLHALFLLIMATIKADRMGIRRLGFFLPS